MALADHLDEASEVIHSYHHLANNHRLTGPPEVEDLTLWPHIREGFMSLEADGKVIATAKKKIFIAGARIIPQGIVEKLSLAGKLLVNWKGKSRPIVKVETRSSGAA